MAAVKKSTVYIDIDDEITAIIDKTLNAEYSIAALVLPKRATVLHSLVNARLLHKAATRAKKKVVLITADDAVIAIASAAGMYVAPTLTSKPEIPKKAVVALGVLEADDKSQESVESNDVSTDNAKGNNTDEDTVSIDNTEVAEEALTIPAEKKKKIKIPDFSSFRLRLGVFGVALILLIVAWVFGFVIMPKADIQVQTDTASVPVDVVATMRVGDTELDTEKYIIPAERAQVEKIDTVTVPATGEKNIGNKASGYMTLTNCIKDDEKKIVPAGTAFSSGGITFVTAEAVTLGPAAFVGNNCISDEFPALGAQGNVDVVAAQSGPEYNLGARSYTSSISGIDAYGSDMSGGTTEIVKVVSAEDVEGAKSQLAGKSKAAATEELQAQLKELGVRPINETLTEDSSAVVASPPVGAEASETKVTMTTTYSMLGVAEDDLTALVEAEIATTLKEQGKEDKHIRDNGTSNLSFIFVAKPNEADQSISIRTVASVGPDVDIEQLKTQVVGKKRGEIEKQIEAIDGVRSVSVEYSPFWITTTPKSAKKISITFNESNETNQ